MADRARISRALGGKRSHPRVHQGRTTKCFNALDPTIRIDVRVARAYPGPICWGSGQVGYGVESVRLVFRPRTYFARCRLRGWNRIAQARLGEGARKRQE